MKLLDEIRLAQNAAQASCAGSDCPMSERVSKAENAMSLIPKIAEYLEDLNERMSKMESKIDDTKGIVEAWGNIKGFGRTMAFVSELLKVSTPIAFFFGFIYLTIINPQLAIEKARAWLTK